MDFKVSAVSPEAASKKVGLSDLEHQLLKKLRGLFAPDQTRYQAGASSLPPLLVAVSGGLDSVVLLHALARLKWVKELAVAHVHHGPSQKPSLQEYRHKAQAFTRDLAQNYQLPFWTNEVEQQIQTGEELSGEELSGELSSEASLRRFRYLSLRDWAQRWEEELGLGTSVQIVLAHHQQDLVETRLMRLVRGTGPRGLPSMEALKGDLLRPLLSISRAELLHYAREQGLKWLEDPSNQDLNPLRNWMRHEWLPQLERQRPGSLLCLGRSLDNLASLSQSAGGGLPWAAFFEGEALRRKVFNSLSHEFRSIVLVEFLRVLELRQFSSRQVEELAKILLSERKSFNFQMMGFTWSVNPDWIYAHPKK